MEVWRCIFICQVGVPINSANQMDVYQENEELKEELQKLAAKVSETFIAFEYSFIWVWKVEFYKIVGMISTNQHIKPTRNAHFAPQTKKQVNCKFKQKYRFYLTINLDSIFMSVDAYCHPLVFICSQVSGFRVREQR